MSESQPTLTDFRHVETPTESECLISKSDLLTFSLAQRKSMQKESETEWLPKQLCHPELDSGSCHRNIIPTKEKINNIPSTSCTAQRKVKGDFVPQKESETGWLSKQLCHPEFISGSCPRKIIPSSENINNIPSASRIVQRHVRGGYAPRKAAFTLTEVFSPFYHLPRRAAFTLAEVLITLGIIGVVAAMTLPTLIQSYKEKQTVAQLKKSYSVLNNAMLLVSNEYGFIDDWEVVPSEVTSEESLVKGNAFKNKFINMLKPYLNVMKFCEFGDPVCDKQAYKVTSLDGTPHELAYSIAPHVVFADGTTISHLWFGLSSSKPYGEIYVDLNGTKSPNRLGEDIFVFGISGQLLRPYGEPNFKVTFSFDKLCSISKTNRMNGYGCAAWVIYNENMDYLKCDGLSWNGKHKCK